MGVMSCSRKDCDNIMCDTYVDSVGYVCNDCQTEFKEYLAKNNLDPQTASEITKELNIFMNIPKDYTDGREISVDAFFNDRRAQYDN